VKSERHYDESRNARCFPAIDLDGVATHRSLVADLDLFLSRNGTQEEAVVLGTHSTRAGYSGLSHVPDLKATTLSRQTPLKMDD